MEESCQLHEFLWAGVPIGVQRKMVYICTSIMLLRISLEKKSLCFPTVPFRVNSSSVIKAGKTRLETIAFRTSITSLLKNFYINESKTCLCM